MDVEDERNSKLISRRRLIGIGVMTGASMLIPGAALARILIPARRSLSFYNLHTDETLKTTYFERGRYLPDALAQINYILRDFRANEIKPIDPKLLDLLVAVRDRIGTNAPFDVISGYRSPATNAMLHAKSEGVASHSMHVQGKAIDVRLPGHDLTTLRDAALSLHVGGVGYYPKSDFVHIDTGRPRWW